MSHSIDATDRENLNGHANFDYGAQIKDAEFNTANKATKDESSEYEKLNRSSQQQSGLNLDKQFEVKNPEVIPDDEYDRNVTCS
jgi:hypothetical protein